MTGGFLIDTIIPSELTKPLADVRVKNWVDAQDTGSLYLSVISVGEIRMGLELLPTGERRTTVNPWTE